MNSINLRESGSPGAIFSANHGVSSVGILGTRSPVTFNEVIQAVFPSSDVANSVPVTIPTELVGSEGDGVVIETSVNAGEIMGNSTEDSIGDSEVPVTNAAGSRTIVDPILVHPSGGAPKKSWTEVSMEVAHKGMALFYDEESAKSEEIDIEMEEVQAEVAKWSHTLMGHVLGARPTLKQVTDFVNKHWNHGPLPLVQYFRKWWFSFRFASADDMNDVLKRVPWSMESHSWILKQWTPTFSSTMECVSVVPIWILLPELDPYLWTDTVLSKIASKIGKPLFADLPTTLQARISFARVMVEADVSQELPEYVVLNCPFTGQSMQRVVYEWLPYYCKTCVANGASEPVQSSSDKASGCHVLGGTSAPKDLEPSSLVVEVASGGSSQQEQGVGFQPSVSVTHSECSVLGQQSRQIDAGFKVVSGRKAYKAGDTIASPIQSSNSFSALRAVVAWNIRGFNKAVKHSEVAGFLALNKVDFCGLLKTRVKSGKAESILRRSFATYSSFCNYNSHHNGRIWLLWHSATTHVTILEEHPQVVHCLLKHHATNREFHISVVYGSNNATERQELWTNLTSFAATVGPWLVLGDFNVIRYEHEKLSLTPPVLSDIVDFNDCLLSCGLDDMNCTGCEFTWHNRQDSGSAVYSKLDRVLINAAWSGAFAQTSAQFLTPGMSDHSLSLITFHGDPLPHKRFSFLNCWADHPRFCNLVNEAWQYNIRGTPMYRLMGKLRMVKRELKKLHQNHYAGIGERVKQKKDELSDCHTALLANPLSDHLIQKEKQASSEYWKFKEAECKILRQRAKLHDLKHGDVSSHYFFSKIKERHQAQIIGAIQDHHGTTHTGLHQVGDAFVAFYQHMLGSSIPVKAIDPSVISNGNVVDVTDFAALTRPVTREEIKLALFAIDSNKSPGIDGFSSGFFKAAWHIIEDDFCAAVEDFFRTSFMPKQANATLVSLIPKKPVPQTVRDFRPISCCSVIYKTGLVKGYDRKGITPRCMVKVDISKAFDTLQWDFIRSMLTSLNFPPIFVGWIMGCITGSWFSIKVNGSPHGFFKGKSGVRQGDPLSPYLFVLSMEILSRCFRVMCDSPNVSFHPKCTRTRLNHLIFADDLMVFVRGDMPSVTKVVDILRIFADWSGLRPNLEKTEVFFGGVALGLKN
ncbi:hypothetical protein RND81_04G056300 [Saponaria officinalis]|uniref:Reverse transcriptase domain-containing protein n=1 Tax=Saponaria officinalis TaxID=3572 RepID=A0AAW1LCS5_SAPOF